MTPADWRRLAELAEEHAIDVVVSAGGVRYTAARTISVQGFAAALRREAERAEGEGPLARLKAVKDSRPFVITHNHEPCKGCELDFQLLRRVVDTLVPPTKEEP